ncbi:MAG: RluA family pseudouridine synthase [Acidimicrobiia bacterium]|nr:RluA family pseudouridine synthase [Acidimicrobiia bacterium]
MTERSEPITPDLAGLRVDVVVARLADASRATVRRAFDEGRVTVDGAPVRPSERIGTGSIVAFSMPEGSASVEADATVDVVVIHEDDSVIVVDKPAGLVVHPGAGTTRSTLVHGLLARYPDLEGVGQEGRWGIVHRLDRDTSGILVVARTDDAYDSLVGALKRREVHRRYVALASGVFANATGTIEAPIGRDPHNRTRMHVVRDGRRAVSHYRRLASWNGHDRTLLSVDLDTGRTHQIRVHLQAIDHPIVGDRAYGRVGGAGDPGRPWLHARRLVFDHPSSGRRMDFLAPLPDDLSDTLSALGAPDLGATIDADGAIL